MIISIIVLVLLVGFGFYVRARNQVYNDCIPTKVVVTSAAVAPKAPVVAPKATAKKVAVRKTK